MRSTPGTLPQDATVPFSDLALAEEFVRADKIRFFTDRRSGWRRWQMYTGWTPISRDEAQTAVFRHLRNTHPHLVTTRRVAAVERLARLVSAERQGF